MSPLRLFYLLLSICGLLVTWYFNLQFMAAGGGLMDFIREGSNNLASQSLSNDLLIATIAGCTWIVVEAKRLNIKYGWAYVLVSFSIAFAFAFPLFLFVRERKLGSDK